LKDNDVMPAKEGMN